MAASNSKASTQLTSGSHADVASRTIPSRGKPVKEPDHTPQNVRFEPFENRAYDMSYACLLIPRDPEHLLVGKLADFLEKALQNVCIAFGWNLRMVQVQPEYMQWVINAKVGTPPSKCIHMIREETSKGVMGAFKHLKGMDAHSDFWAPGYLVLVGDKPHHPGIIQEFIKLTRQQQGLRQHGHGQDLSEDREGGA